MFESSVLYKRDKVQNARFGYIQRIGFHWMIHLSLSRTNQSRNISENPDHNCTLKINIDLLNVIQQATSADNRTHLHHCISTLTTVCMDFGRLVVQIRTNCVRNCITCAVGGKVIYFAASTSVLIPS